jgi:hypothetical protein
MHAKNEDIEKDDNQESQVGERGFNEESTRPLDLFICQIPRLSGSVAHNSEMVVVVFGLRELWP